MNYISVDFSLNSPGICLYNDNTNKYHFISYIKKGSGTKKEQKLQEEISLLDDVTLNNQPDWESTNQYSSAELLKIRRYNSMSNDILELILQHTDNSSDYIIAFEGSSYGSKMGTNNIIDMAAGAAILKNNMLETIKPLDIKTIAPTTIKKHAGKGNMKKRALWDAFVENRIQDENIKTSKFFNFCDKLIEPEDKKIPKPFDDLVDAYFLCNYLFKVSNE
tara:strand:+ start:953 stop:1612 length:660 start_codon:yes stop_codon:yes gene_type:complete